MIWDGYPEETNAAYGLAKKMMIVQSEAYKKQYNFDSISIKYSNNYNKDFNIDKWYSSEKLNNLLAPAEAPNPV